MISKIKGLKYPDEFITKFFFKKGLNTKPGKVLELGCGNGNNLMLFHGYGWDIVGVDIDQKLLQDASYNIKLMNPEGGGSEFIHKDLSEGIDDVLNSNYIKPNSFSAVILPSVLYYIPRKSAEKVLREVSKYTIPGAFIYLRNRTLRDYRYRRGEEVERNGYRLTLEETGESGLLNIFYNEWEIIEMLVENLKLDAETAEILTVEFQSPQRGVRVLNSDIVVWGKVGM